MKLCIFFFVMVIFGIFFNAMNILLYKPSHFYLSPTLIYAGCFMGGLMFCAHEIIHFFTIGHFNIKLFLLGIVLATIFALLLRFQVGINTNSWMRRMIPHHSIALTTSSQLLKNGNLDKTSKTLATNIVKSQKEEIQQMQNYLQKN